MIKYVYAAYDKDCECFSDPQIVKDAPDVYFTEQCRAFIKAPDETKTMLLKIKVCFIGTFDDEKGCLIPCDIKELVDFEKINGGIKDE